MTGLLLYLAGTAMVASGTVSCLAAGLGHAVCRGKRLPMSGRALGIVLVAAGILLAGGVLLVTLAGQEVAA